MESSRKSDLMTHVAHLTKLFLNVYTEFTMLRRETIPLNFTQQSRKFDNDDQVYLCDNRAESAKIRRCETEPQRYQNFRLSKKICFNVVTDYMQKMTSPCIGKIMKKGDFISFPFPVTISITCFTITALYLQLTIYRS